MELSDLVEPGSLGPVQWVKVGSVHIGVPTADAAPSRIQCFVIGIDFTARDGHAWVLTAVLQDATTVEIERDRGGDPNDSIENLKKVAADHIASP